MTGPCVKHPFTGMLIITENIAGKLCRSILSDMENCYDITPDKLKIQ